jgi:ABC-type Fe3+-hydroxamate transport system substrate-binding protein
MNRTVRLERAPVRIVSVVPSQTELLHSLGLEQEVVGITKFCIHPELWFRHKTRVGGTKNLNLDRIRELCPDLIIANKEENNEDQIKELMNEYPVWMSDIRTLDDALEMISSVGRLTGKSSNAESIRQRIENAFSEIPASRTPRTAAYFIWRNPYMVAGTGTFIHEMLLKCGLTNIFSDSRYPNVSIPALRESAPELILLASEPYPFTKKHINEFSLISPSSRILVVDGEFFSWYGSRLLEAPAYFNSLFFAE